MHTNQWQRVAEAAGFKKTTGVAELQRRSGNFDARQDTELPKMRRCFCPGSSHLAVLSLILLSPIPRTVSSYPHPSPPAARLPSWDEPDLESVLQLLKADVDEPWPALCESNEVLLRSQRGDLVGRPLSPFPGGLSVDSVHYPVGETDDGGRRNEALNSIAGGLQAVSREKGGFGFRFGRKRWTEKD